jgi:hypothetical protein
LTHHIAMGAVIGRQRRNAEQQKRHNRQLAHIWQLQCSVYHVPPKTYTVVSFTVPPGPVEFYRAHWMPQCMLGRHTVYPLRRFHRAR